MSIVAIRGLDDDRAPPFNRANDLPSEKAEFSAAWTSPPPALRIPTMYLFPTCCAPAESGQAAAPPSSVMNSRRLMPIIGLLPSSASVGAA
jgi:hypothetical protein